MKSPGSVSHTDDKSQSILSAPQCVIQLNNQLQMLRLSEARS